MDVGWRMWDWDVGLGDEPWAIGGAVDDARASTSDGGGKWASDYDCRAGTASVRLMNGGPHERAFSIMSYVSDMARPVLAPSLSFSLSYDDGFGRAFGPERPLAEMGEGEG